MALGHHVVVLILLVSRQTCRCAHSRFRGRQRPGSLALDWCGAPANRPCPTTCFQTHVTCIGSPSWANHKPSCTSSTSYRQPSAAPYKQCPPIRNAHSHPGLLVVRRSLAHRDLDLNECRCTSVCPFAIERAAPLAIYMAERIERAP